jgi:hypothetical protein
MIVLGVRRKKMIRKIINKNIQVPFIPWTMRGLWNALAPVIENKIKRGGSRNGNGEHKLLKIILRPDSGVW